MEKNQTVELGKCMRTGKNKVMTNRCVAIQGCLEQTILWLQNHAEGGKGSSFMVCDISLSETLLGFPPPGIVGGL